jgi:hypothetical protein
MSRERPVVPRSRQPRQLRLLFVIPHFFSANKPNGTNRSRSPTARDERIRALMATIGGLHQTFGQAVYGLDHFGRAAWQASPPTRHVVDIVICTTGSAHLLDALPPQHPPYRHHMATVDPEMLGFECHRLLREARGRYDYYGYIEDDIVLLDPLFFRKRQSFDRRFGPEALLQPNRYEARPDGPVQKLYVDYHLSPARTAPYQNVREQPRLELPFLDETIIFERTSYPSAGCFFLNPEQLEIWAESPASRDHDVSYLSPLDSAVTLSIMKTFRVYKPVLDQAWFLEVLHASPRWIHSVAELTRLVPRELPFAPHLSQGAS